MKKLFCKDQWARTVNTYRGFTNVRLNHPDFITQIDINILDAVIILNSKGFPTVGSCQGHGFLEYLFTDRKNFVFTGPYIVIRPNNNDQHEYIIKSFNTLLTKTIIEYDKTIWIEFRSIKYFLSNRYLCNILTKLCNELKII